MPPESFEDFKKRNPHLESFWPYLDLLNKESDRGAVLISTGFLEQQLKDVLLSFMVDRPRVATLLKDGIGPLGTFSSRITACYALALISEDERFDLDQMRSIRNGFAHDINTSFRNAERHRPMCHASSQSAQL